MLHRGEIIEKVVRESGYPITKLAAKLGKSRRHVYNIFENNRIDWDTIREIGRLIHHDFSQEFKELSQVMQDEQVEYVNLYKDERDQYKRELDLVNKKYIELLEKYNILLNEQLKKQKK